MKKFIVGLILGGLLAMPIAVFADHEGHLGQTNHIYDVGDGGIGVAVFDDQDNKCYVAYEHRPNDSMPSISCVKGAGE
jgi:hypothetical protein